MNKIIIIFLVLIGIVFISGCAEEINTIELEDTEEEPEIEIEVEKEERVDKIKEEISPEEYCDTDDDCILVISGCSPCPSCKDYEITDPEVIAVNKNVYKCPPRPKNLHCILCIGRIGYDFYEDAICVNNKCEKKEEENKELLPYTISIIEGLYEGEDIITFDFDKNLLVVRQTFSKPNPCTSMNYIVDISNSTSSSFIIDIFQKEIPKKPVINPETGEEILTECVAILAYDFVEINFTYKKGTRLDFDLNFYRLGDSTTPFYNGTAMLIKASTGIALPENETEDYQKMLNIAKSAFSLMIEDMEVLNYDPEVGLNMINEEINFLDDKWHINLTANYEFGCCRGCAPGNVCAAVCAPCSTKTIEGYFRINKMGLIEQKNIREIACKENTGVWDGSRILVGKDCSS